MNKQIIDKIIDETVNLLGGVDIKARQSPILNKVFENLIYLKEEISKEAVTQNE